jgi:hypothetical protein
MSCVDDSKKIWVALVVQLYTGGNDYHFVCMIFQKKYDLFYYKFHLLALFSISLTTSLYHFPGNVKQRYTREKNHDMYAWQRGR